MTQLLYILRYIPSSVLIFCSCALFAFAQSPSFTLLNIDLGDYPSVRAQFFLNDTNGTPIRDLRSGDFLIRENGVDASHITLACPSPAPPVQISSVLAIDVSGSMLNRGNIDIARAAANLWIDRIPLGYSDCAVTSFDHASYLNRDFTIDRAALHDAVAGLSPGGGTDYNAGLINDPAGAVRVAAQGKHKRVVIFLTDGVGNGDYNAILQAAQQDDVVIYAVVLRMGAPQILKDLALQTGGLWFENVGSQEDAEAIFSSILRVAQGEEPCTLSWENIPDCIVHRELEIEIPLYNVSWGGAYNVADTLLPRITFSPFGVSFGVISSGSTKDTTITITAHNRPVTITDMNGGEPLFTVVGGADDLPFTLQPGESRTLTVRFSPTDSTFRYGKINLESDACSGSGITCTGGLPGLRSPEATLKLVKPNGGEVFAVGNAIDIEWEGVLPEDTVTLEYSVDAGMTWIPITNDAVGLRYQWSAPATPSNRCLMRVRQRTFGPESGVLTIPSTDRLYACDFSPDDRFVAVGGSEINVYDAYSGNHIVKVDSQLRTVLTLEFGLDGTSLLSGSANLTTDLYDWTVPQVKRSFSNNLTLSAAAFSPDNQYIVSHSYDDEITIFETATGRDVRRLTGHTLRGFAVDWSPDGSRIVSGGTDNLAIIWDAATGAILYTLPHISWVNSTFFSPDGTRVVTACSDGGVRLWDAETGTLIMTIPGSVPVASARYSPDGSQLCITRYDPVVEIRDAKDGSLIRQLIGHTRTVPFADWNSDGSRILTVSWDNSARIWDLGLVPDQVDQSDNLWSIVMPEVSGLEVDMGRVGFGSSRDSVVQRWLCNTGTVPIHIDDISLQRRRYFSIVSGFAPLDLAPGDCVPVEFRFVPGRVGLVDDSVDVRSGILTWTFSIRGEGILDPLSVITRSIDFGQVTIGEVRDTVVTVVVKNTGPTPIAITRTALTGPDNDQFFILSGGGAFGLNSGESRQMELRFAPMRKGRTSGTISFEYEGIANAQLGLPPAVVSLYGEGICPEDTPDHTLSFPPLVEAAPGERIAVPILVNSDVDPVPSVRHYTLLLRYNKSLLAPLDSVALNIETERERFLLYEGEWSGESDTLGLFSFIAALGDAESTPLTIESFLWKDGCSGGLTTKDGEFRPKNLCNEGGTRLFFVGDSIFLKPVVPNPVRGHAQIQYGVIEDGETNLFLVNSKGEQVAVLVKAPLPPGAYLLDFNTSELPSGTYFVLLKTPTKILSEQLLIER